MKPQIEPTAIPPRWYMVSADGIATLCANEADARSECQRADNYYHRRAPHRAVLLGDVDAERERWQRIATNAHAVTTGGKDRIDYFEVPSHLIAALALALDEGPNVGIEPPRSGRLE